MGKMLGCAGKAGLVVKYDCEGYRVQWRVKGTAETKDEVEFEDGLGQVLNQALFAHRRRLEGLTQFISGMNPLLVS